MLKNRLILLFYCEPTAFFRPSARLRMSKMIVVKIVAFANLTEILKKKSNNNIVLPRDNYLEESKMQ